MTIRFRENPNPQTLYNEKYAGGLLMWRCPARSRRVPLLQLAPRATWRALYRLVTPRAPPQRVRRAGSAAVPCTLRAAALPTDGQLARAAAPRAYACRRRACCKVRACTARAPWSCAARTACTCAHSAAGPLGPRSRSPLGRAALLLAQAPAARVRLSAGPALRITRVLRARCSQRCPPQMCPCLALTKAPPQPAPSWRCLSRRFTQGTLTARLR